MLFSIKIIQKTIKGNICNLEKAVFRFYPLSDEGWAVTRDTTAQVMFILFGSGANGKSTFLNTPLGILGDYAAAAAQTQTFQRQHNNDRMSNDVACPRGARFVTTTEAEQGARLSESLIN